MYSNIVRPPRAAMEPPSQGKQPQDKLFSFLLGAKNRSHFKIFLSLVHSFCKDSERSESAVSLLDRTGGRGLASQEKILTWSLLPLSLRGCRSFEETWKECFKMLWLATPEPRIDTCCIEKRSSAELSEAICSMYRWYAGAQVCYASQKIFPLNPNKQRPCQTVRNPSTLVCLGWAGYRNVRI